MKHCIFHIPLEIDPNYMSGSHIRPIKMLRAFEAIGYTVDFIEGDAKTRKEKMDQVKEKVKQGVVYDFMYAENSNMPTLLTEKHHLPTHPLLDFGFFKWVKAQGIPIGLYYRDIHWVYPAYRKNVPGIKGLFATQNFKYDLRQYEKYLDIFYLQTKQMEKKFPRPLHMDIKELPPGADKGVSYTPVPTKPFHVFYVGGLGSHYEMEELFKAVEAVEDVTMTVCTRESDWKAHEHMYGKYVGDRIRMIHKNYDELEPYFKEATVLARYFISENSPDYNDFCISIKVFEYMGNMRPIFSIKDTAIGDFLEKNDIGWAVPYDAKAMEELFRYLLAHPEEIKEKQENVVRLLPSHTWEARAQQVADDLLPLRRTR